MKGIDELKKEVLNKIGMFVKQRAIELCPIDKGELRRSIKYKVEGNVVTIYTENCDYASDMEYGCFFNPNTKIHTKGGLKKLKDLKIGDYVWTGRTYKKVIQKERIDIGYLINKKIIKTLKSTIELTSDHLIFTANRGWTKASEIEKGDRLIII